CILDAFSDKTQIDLLSFWQKQMSFISRFKQIVVVDRFLVTVPKKLVTVKIHFIPWRGCEPKYQAIEIIKNMPVLIVNRTMCLIYDDQIKVTNAIYSVCCLYSVDNRLIGRKDNPGRHIVFLLSDISTGIGR